MTHDIIEQCINKSICKKKNKLQCPKLYELVWTSIWNNYSKLQSTGAIEYDDCNLHRVRLSNEYPGYDKLQLMVLWELWSTSTLLLLPDPLCHTWKPFNRSQKMSAGSLPIKMFLYKSHIFVQKNWHYTLYTGWYTVIHNRPTNISHRDVTI